MKLYGEVALVTGASRGIGRRLSLRLANEGFSLGLISRKENDCNEVAEECKALGVDVEVYPLDVRDRAETQKTVSATIRRFGKIDLLINNAAVVESAGSPLWETHPDEWVKIIETNLLGPYFLNRYVVPGMISSRRGRVIHLSTNAVTLGRPDYSAYCTSKIGLLRMSELLNARSSRYEVFSFDITPGVVMTDMTKSSPIHEGRDYWTPIEKIADLVVRIAYGQLDHLAGRFLRAEDDIDTLHSLTSPSDRRLRVNPHGTTDVVAFDPDPGVVPPTKEEA
ncbi:SDR family NAD(P)-dependent oxidoreductase [Streptomyces microflavus]|uniref:SDR family NAD(P)-dependent oxidoreductase n=1 Tax=Streptomyces microflavus TaxID=1919 RepID=UPI00364F2805